MSQHPSQESLHSLKSGNLSSGDLGVLRHMGVCEICRGRFLATAQPRGGYEEEGLLVTADRYSGVLDKVFDLVLDESQHLEGQRSLSGELARELDTFSPSQQKLVVTNLPRYQNWALAEQLLLDCRGGWSNDPKGSEAKANLALTVIDRLDVGGYRQRLLADLRSEAWSYVANCRRIRFDLTGAVEAFSKADEALKDGTGDALESARLEDLRASYLCTAGEFEAAAKSLHSAIRSYRAAGDSHLEGRSHFTYAKVLYDSGHLDDAVSALSEATALIDPNRDPYLEFQLKWMRVLYLTELGETAEASRLLPEARELARERAPRLEKLRFLWTEGLLRKNLGQWEMAAEALKQVREGFAAAEMPSDVALVSLDLAALYLEVGRTDQVRSLASETMQLFASRGVQRKMLMAWNLFGQAAEKDQATLHLVAQVADEIKRVAARPAS